LSRFAAFIDYLSLSFPADESGLIGDGFEPQDFSGYLVSLLAACGMDGAALLSRDSGMYGYSSSAYLLRTSISPTQPINGGLVAYTPTDHRRDDKTSKKYQPGYFLSLSGMGCKGVNLQLFVDTIAAFNPRITRLDVAIDYYEGELSFDKLQTFYTAGYFRSNGGRMPRKHVIQPQAMTPDGSLEKRGGYTMYVGKRGGARHARGYEKAHQMINESVGITSEYINWFRLEVELRSADAYVIPLDALISDRLDDLLLAAYPNLFHHLPIPSHVTNVTLQPLDPYCLAFETPELKVSLEHLQGYLTLSYGGVLNAMLSQGFSADEIVSKLRPSDKDKLPRRLLFPITQEELKL